jgi:hypothetical protein
MAFHPFAPELVAQGWFDDVETTSASSWFDESIIEPTWIVASAAIAWTGTITVGTLELGDIFGDKEISGAIVFAGTTTAGRIGKGANVDLGEVKFCVRLDCIELRMRRCGC